jgi:predicted transcriptional regulator
MSGKQPITSITIRIPAEIAEILRRLAKQHDRSLNGEIVRALREYTEKRHEKQPREAATRSSHEKQP